MQLWYELFVKNKVWHAKYSENYYPNMFDKALSLQDNFD